MNKNNIYTSRMCKRNACWTSTNESSI